MPMIAWRIGTVSDKYLADDLKGTGAERTGGRWNRPGKPVVYTSSTIALAALETVVHLSNSLPLNRYLVEVIIPDAIWHKRETLDHSTAPMGWDACPTGMPSLDYGDDWLDSQRSAILLVPSVVVPEESNILLNPKHPDAGQITARMVRKWLYDVRIKAV